MMMNSRGKYHGDFGTLTFVFKFSFGHVVESFCLTLLHCESTQFCYFLCINVPFLKTFDGSKPFHYDLTDDCRK